jgi:glycosyltransferase involved in cell wall biosynthesis
VGLALADSAFRAAGVAGAGVVPDGVATIVHVLSSYGVGGQERVALDLAIGQRQAGHTLHVVSLAAQAPGEPGPLAREFAAAGVATHEVPRRDGLDPTLTVKLARCLRGLGADVVHTHNPLPLIYGAPAARLIGAVSIHTKHGRNPGGRGHRLLRRAAAELTHAFVAVSDVTAAQARQLHDCSSRKLHVIPNGIRLERFAPNPRARAEQRLALGIPDDAWVVGSVGRLDEFKNHVLLVRALAPHLSRRLQLVLVGEGPARADIEAAVAAVPDGRYVHLLGRRMDVDQIMPAFDVFALPSRSEGLPLVLPEAMACALPIVATEVGGVPSVVDEGETGLLVPVDEAALADALGQLAADPARAKAMGRHAREAALARFSAQRMVHEYLELYRRCGARL